jgi:hypothetical protein
MRVLFYFCENPLICTAYREIGFINCIFQIVVQRPQRAFADCPTELIISKRTTTLLLGRILHHGQIEFEFVYHSLQGADIRIPSRQKQSIGSFSTDRQPLVFVAAQFIRTELSSFGMTVIVAVDFGVTIKADWYCVVGRVRSPVRCLNYVVQFHFHTAKPVANAAASVTGNQ